MSEVLFISSLLRYLLGILCAVNGTIPFFIYAVELVLIPTGDRVTDVRLVIFIKKHRVHCRQNYNVASFILSAVHVPTVYFSVVVTVQGLRGSPTRASPPECRQLTHFRDTTASPLPRRTPATPLSCHVPRYSWIWLGTNDTAFRISHFTNASPSTPRHKGSRLHSLCFLLSFVSLFCNRSLELAAELTRFLFLFFLSIGSCFRQGQGVAPC